MQLFINYAAVLVAGLAALALGYVWYGPLFGKKWMSYMGITNVTEEDKKGMWKGYAIQLASSVVTAFALAFFVKIFGIADVRGALVLSLWIVIGFFATTGIGSVIWEKKPWGYYFLNTGYNFVSVYVMALILAFWQ